MTLRSRFAFAGAALAFVVVGRMSATDVLGTADAAARNDPELVTALVNDPQLGRCACVVGARWIDESYARVAVSAAKYARLDRAARARFGKRALRVAEATYLAENAAVDQYEEIFIVDERGRPLASGRP